MNLLYIKRKWAFIPCHQLFIAHILRISMEFKVKILKIEPAAFNVLRITTEKPSGFSFTPGQATDMSINAAELKDKKSAFTFTCLPEYNYLEFTIKIYEDHENGVTQHFRELRSGDELIISEPFGAIRYSGPGVFLAGGAGVTPFISILRMLRKQNSLKGNTLILSNKTSNDIINEEELRQMQKEGLSLTLILTREQNKKYIYGRITEEYLRENIASINKQFYVCGPVTFVGEIQFFLKKLGVSAQSIVFEK